MSLIGLVAAAILWFTGHNTSALLAVLAAVVLFVPRWFSPKTREQTREFSQATKSLQVFDALSSKELRGLQTSWLGGPRQAGVSARDFVKAVLIETGHPAARIVTSGFVDGPIEPQVETVSFGADEGAVTVVFTRYDAHHVEHLVRTKVRMSDAKLEEYLTLAKRTLARRQFEAGGRPWEPQWLPDGQRDQVRMRFGR